MLLRRSAHSALLAGVLVSAFGPLTVAMPQANTSEALPALKNGQRWKLVWSDEFDGNAIDKTKWATPGERVARGPGAWSDKALKVSNGVLEFKIAREDGQLVTCAISTEGRFSATYGYWVIRAKLPRTPGYRPAFWLSSKNINDPKDPSHPTEIDVLEYPGRNGNVRVNLHWGGYKEFHQTSGSSAPLFDATQFHTYGVWWNESGYSFYIDGRLVWKSAGGGASTGPEFIRLGNELFSADAAVNTTQAAGFPANDNFTVDYVRVYQIE